MNHKQLAAEIYAMRPSKRKAEVDKLPDGDRGVVWGYVDQLGNQAKAECRRRNTQKMGKKSPRNKPGRPA